MRIDAVPVALLLLVGAGIGGALVLAATLVPGDGPARPFVLTEPHDCPLTLTLLADPDRNRTTYTVEWLEHGPLPLAGLRYRFTDSEAAPALEGNVTDLAPEGPLRYEDRAGAADTLDPGDAVVREAEPYWNLELSNAAGEFGGTMRCL